METKANLSPTGCFARALPDEPMMVFLARDPCAPAAIRHWADLRVARGTKGDEPEDAENMTDALETAEAFERWRVENDGAWRDQPATGIPDGPTPSDTTTSIAGRILGGGDPLENEQVLRSLEQLLADQGIFRIIRDEDPIGETRRRLVKALRAALGPYLENAQTLAGFVLKADPKAGPND